MTTQSIAHPHPVRRSTYGLAFVLIGLLISLIFGSVTRISAIEIQAAPTIGSFIHTVSAANLVNGQSVISHVLTNNNPDALLFITQNTTPNGDAQPIQLGQAAAWYDDVQGRWRLRAVDGTLAVGASYNIYVSPVNANHWLHFDVNPVAGATELDYAAINNNPSAIIQVTHRAGGIVFNNHPIALDYNEGTGHWYIVNQDDEPMPDDVTFNIRLATTIQGGKMVFAGPDADFDGIQSVIVNHDALNGNPNAKFWITPQVTEIVPEYTYPVAAKYNSTLDRWMVTRLTNGSIGGGLFHLHIAQSFISLTSEVVQNGSFETADALNVKRADLWTANVVHKGARKCNHVATDKYLSFDGDCAYEFKGIGGFKTTIQQSHEYASPITSGKTFNFSAYVKGKNLTSGAKIMAIFRNTDGISNKLTLDTVGVNAGTYAYKRLETSVISMFDYDKITVKIQMKGSAGKLWVDNLSLTYSVTLSSQTDGQNALIPLPVAP